MDVLFSALPLVVVVFLMAGPWPLPATIALPITALGTLFIRWFWFGADVIGLSADAFAGVIAALTPILIVGGAVAVFQALERGGALALAHVAGLIESASHHAADDRGLGFCLSH